MNWRRTVRAFLITAALVYGLAAFLYADSLTGLYQWNAFGDFTFLLIPAIAGIVAAFSAIGLLFAKVRPKALVVCVVSLALVPMAIPAYLAASQLGMFGFYVMSKWAQPVVEAVARYERDRGMPPVSLNDLSPTYLTSMPRALAQLQILTGERARLHYCKGNEWVLMIPASVGVLNFDEFFYLPAQNYEQCEITSIARLGKWAYFHE